MKIRTRFWVAIMIFFSTYVNYMFRVNLSISIIAMVQPSGGKVLKPECLNQTITKNATLPDFGPRYPWSQTVQGLVLGGYFYGFIPSSLLAGPACEKFGPWKTNLVVSIIQGVLNTLTPIAASIHYGVAFTIRLLMGLTGGVAYPAMQSIIAKWAPPAEKGKFASMLLGNTIGIVVTWPLVGQITQSINWQWGFYILSILMFAYCVAFFFLVADNPHQHWFISQEEKDYIEESHKGVVSKKKAMAPYRKILMCRPFWALTIANFGNLWGLFLLITGAPKFLVEVMGFDIRSSGLLAALPYLGRFFGGFIFGWVGDLMKASGKLKTWSIRKIAVIFSHFLAGLGALLIITVGCNATIVVALMIISLSLNGAIIMGHLQTPQDLAPNFSATLHGWMMGFSGVTGFIVPAITGAIIEKHNGIAEWHTIFGLGGSIYILCGILFVLIGSATLQSWNEIKEDEEVKEESS